MKSEKNISKKNLNKLKFKDFLYDTRNFIFITLDIITLIIFTLVIILSNYFMVNYEQTLIKYRKEANDKVNNSNVTTFNDKQSTYIYSNNGTVLAKLRLDEDKIYVDYNNIPQNVVNAFISVEDRNFWTHNGIDTKGLFRVVIDYILTKGTTIHGASTITQQLSRNIFLNFEVTFDRKIKEAFIALALEDKYTKEEIMEFYLNNIYFSNNYYGIATASKGYFSKTLSELTLSEIAFLTAIPNNPEILNPLTNFNNTMKRRDKILKDMLDAGYINQIEYKVALAEKITLKPFIIETYNYEVTYAIDCAIKILMEYNNFNFKYEFNTDKSYRKYLEKYNEKYNIAKLQLYTGGYIIKTSIDINTQNKLQTILDKNLKNFKEKKTDGVYDVQGAITVIDNKTGNVTAIIGGRTQNKLGSYTYNRAFQSKRQPASVIKPIVVYAPALEQGYYPNTMVRDEKKGSIDYPKNNDDKYEENITLRYALAMSKNTTAWDLFNTLTADYCMKYLIDMQFESVVKSDYTSATALGGMTYGVNTVEMASAYRMIANYGEFTKATCITSMKDTKGNELLFKEVTKIISKRTAQFLLNMMKDVFSYGTANNLKLNNNTLVGKTGTSNNNRDGWFCGMSTKYTVAVWVGSDTNKSISSLEGSTYPLKIWDKIMKYLSKNHKDTNFSTSLIDDYLALEKENGMQEKGITDNYDKLIEEKKQQELDKAKITEIEITEEIFITNEEEIIETQIQVSEKEEEVENIEEITMRENEQDWLLSNQIEDDIVNLKNIQIITNEDIEVGNQLFKRIQANIQSIINQDLKYNYKLELNEAYDIFYYKYNEYVIANSPTEQIIESSITETEDKLIEEIIYDTEEPINKNTEEVNEYIENDNTIDVS